MQTWSKKSDEKIRRHAKMGKSFRVKCLQKFQEHFQEICHHEYLQCHLEEVADDFGSRKNEYASEKKIDKR